VFLSVLINILLQRNTVQWRISSGVNCVYFDVKTTKGPVLDVNAADGYVGANEQGQENTD
jgi:hypothetical protein